MNLCDDDHEEVAYIESSCPVCAMEDDKLKEIEAIEEERDDLKQQVSDLTDEIEELNIKLDELSSIEDSIKQAIKERL